jgi:hypothetical protein
MNRNLFQMSYLSCQESYSVSVENLLIIILGSNPTKIVVFGIELNTFFFNLREHLYTLSKTLPLKKFIQSWVRIRSKV